MHEQPIIRFTDTLSGSVDKLNKAGGFALALGFAGIFMILGAELFRQREQYLLIAIGIVLTLSCLSIFLYTTLKGIRVSKSIADNKAAVDTLQDLAIQLSRLTNTAQAYRNIEKLNKALKVAIPVLKSIPVVGNKVIKYGLEDAGKISQAIVDNSEKIESVSRGIEQALINADHQKLSHYTNELSEIVAAFKQQPKL